MGFFSKNRVSQDEYKKLMDLIDGMQRDIRNLKSQNLELIAEQEIMISKLLDGRKKRIKKSDDGGEQASDVLVPSDK